MTKKNKPSKSLFKRITGWLHLWVGLVTGIVIVIVSLTGCIFVFEEELFDIIHSDITHVKETGPQKPVSLLLANAQRKLGKDKPVNNLVINKGDNKSFIFEASGYREPEDWGFTYFSQLNYMDRVFVNQYTGEVLGVVDVRYEFFHVVEQIHRQLLLTRTVGRLIVGVCTLLFILMLITGMILWWPKNFKQFKRSVKIKWDAKWKRINYDLHNSVGFYTFPVALLIAVTGLVWSFKWWENGIYVLMGGNDKKLFKKEMPVLTNFSGDTSLNKTDLVYTKLRKAAGDSWDRIVLGLPEESNKQIMGFVHTNNNRDGWKGASYFYFDGRTGDQFASMPHETKSLGMKWRNSNYFIHTGGIYGFWTKVIAFLSSLVSASLPITGFIIWWEKEKKKKKRIGKDEVKKSALASPVV